MKFQATEYYNRLQWNQNNRFEKLKKFYNVKYIKYCFYYHWIFFYHDCIWFETNVIIFSIILIMGI